jgi:hypothetical protein
MLSALSIFITAIRTKDEKLLKTKLVEQQQNLNYSGLDLGYIYHSDAVSSENDQVLSISPMTLLQQHCRVSEHLM